MSDDSAAKTAPQSSPNKVVDKDYTAKQIEYKSDLEHVRSRPGMYIGDTGTHGMHHLVYEAVDNSIDEAMAGHATDILVEIRADGSARVTDDGRGIPVDIHPELGISTLEGVMTKLKMGGKFGGDSGYEKTGGLHGIGVKAVNFMSQWCEVEVKRDGKVHQQVYERGIPQGPVTEIGKAKSTGTTISFKPDPEMFGDLKFDSNTLHKRLQELAFLNNGVKITFRDERNSTEEVFQYQEGIIEYVRFLNRASDPIHPDVVYIGGDYEGNQIDVAFQYASEYTENIHCFVNNINTKDGGTHLTGFRTALTRTLNAYGKKANLFKDVIPSGDDFREGLTAIVAVRIQNPQFTAQTKDKLNNPELEGIVNSAVGDFLNKYLEEHPRIATTLIRKAVTAAEAREAARKAKDLLRKRKDALGGGGLPGKLRDCISKKMEECEVYLVEGDSAGGSAEGGRMREFQAILPLRGKIINAYKSREDKVLANEEVQSMIQAIGTGIGADQDLTKRRYNRVVIMTDADVDGSHIRTLLLCFFYRQMYQLVAGGHVYLAQPPLFRVVKGKQKHYVQTDEEMKKQLLDRGLSDGVLETEDGRRVEGDDMRKLCEALASCEDAIVALERRGISLKAHSLRLDPNSGLLPPLHLFVDQVDHWFADQTAMKKFLDENNLSLDGPEEDEQEDNAKPSAEDAAMAAEDEPEAETGPSVRLVELHEVRSINAALKDIIKLNFGIDDLIPQERTGATEPRFKLIREENERGLEDLRGLLSEVRAAGEKGLTITRFKGLGEMNAEELRETTLDPENRTLIKVNLDDAGAADEMFRLLMGDKVEPRREFIEKHALDVRNLDV